MKKFFYFLAILSLFSCGEQKKQSSSPAPKPSFSEVAQRELYAVIDRRLPHDPGAAPKIMNEKVVINTDSAYFLTFEMSFKNQFNGWSHGGFTFVCVQMDGYRKVCLRDGMDPNMIYLTEDNKDEMTPYQKALNYCTGFLSKDYTEDVW